MRSKTGSSQHLYPAEKKCKRWAEKTSVLSS